jgi:hypothetical protein
MEDRMDKRFQGNVAAAEKLETVRRRKRSRLGQNPLRTQTIRAIKRKIGRTRDFRATWRLHLSKKLCFIGLNA